MSLIISAASAAQDIVAFDQQCTENEGLLGWSCETAKDGQSVLRTIAVTVAILFVVVRGIMAKLAVGAILLAALAGAILIWVVFRVTDLTGEVGDNLPSTSGLIPATAFLDPGPRT